MKIFGIIFGLLVLFSATSDAKVVNLYMYTHYNSGSYNTIQLENDKKAFVEYSSHQGSHREFINGKHYEIPKEGKVLRINLPDFSRNEKREFSEKIEFKIDNVQITSFTIVDGTTFNKNKKNAEQGTIGFLIWLKDGLKIQANSKIEIYLLKKDGTKLTIPIPQPIVSEWAEVNSFVFTKESKKQLEENTRRFKEKKDQLYD